MNYERIIKEIELYQENSKADVVSFQKNLVAKKYKDILCERVLYIEKPTLLEIIYQIKNELNSRPLCKVCGLNETKFKTHINNYATYCSMKCLHNDKEQKSKNSLKAVETLRSTIDPETGLNLSKKRAYKTSETLRTTLDENGVSLLERRTQKAMNTHLSNIDKNGLNSYQRLGIESSKIQTSREHKIKYGFTLPEDIPSLEYYVSQVRNLSDKTYRKFKDVINPDNLERSRKKYHLDHKVSIREGFENNIPIHIMSSVYNLEMKSAFDNLSKWKYSDIKLEELLKFF